MKTKKQFSTKKVGSFATAKLLATMLCIVAALAIIGCKEDEPDPPPPTSPPEVNLADYTYTLKQRSVTSVEFTNTFGEPIPTAGNARIFTGTKADLETKFAGASVLGTGRLYSNLESSLQSSVNNNDITASQKTSMLNALKSAGATGFAYKTSETNFLAIGIFRE